VLLHHALLSVTLAVVLSLAGVTATADACPKTSSKLVPNAGALLGAYVNPDESWRGLEDDKQKVRGFEALIGRRLGIDMHYYRWEDAFPTALEEWDAAECRAPMVAWAGTDLAAIARGDHDAQIRARARAVKRFARPIFIRWAYEMNGDWWNWATANTSRDPSTFVAAWRRIHRLFRSTGASNAVWVWSPNEASFPNEPWNQPESYYPGDDVVDWVGIDGYNWGAVNASSGWRTFADIFRPVYTKYAGRKPVMVAETASTEAGGDKAAWINTLHRSLAEEFPAVRALIWFHSHKETDWRVDSSPAALEAFRNLALDPLLAAP